MLKQFAAAALVSTAQGAKGTYDYISNGADWPSITYPDGTVNQCGSTNQSPIDLKKDLPADKMVEAKTDQYSKLYSNLDASADKVKLSWKSGAANIEVRPQEEVQQFNSRWSTNTFRNPRYQAV